MVRSGKMTRAQADALLLNDGIDRTAIDSNLVSNLETKIWEVLARDDSDIVLTQLATKLMQEAEIAERAAPVLSPGEEELVEQRANVALGYLLHEVRNLRGVLDDMGARETMLRLLRVEVRKQSRAGGLQPDGQRIIYAADSGA